MEKGKTYVIKNSDVTFLTASDKQTIEISDDINSE
jgi:hypothetical protein